MCLPICRERESIKWVRAFVKVFEWKESFGWQPVFLTRSGKVSHWQPGSSDYEGTSWRCIYLHSAFVWDVAIHHLSLLWTLPSSLWLAKIWYSFAITFPKQRGYILVGLKSICELVCMCKSSEWVSFRYCVPCRRENMSLESKTSMQMLPNSRQTLNNIAVPVCMCARVCFGFWGNIARYCWVLVSIYRLISAVLTISFFFLKSLRKLEAEPVEIHYSCIMGQNAFSSSLSLFMYCKYAVNECVIHPLLEFYFPHATNFLWTEQCLHWLDVMRSCFRRYFYQLKALFCCTKLNAVMSMC